MPCLVCQNPIQISGFLRVFTLEEPLLCHRCSPHLKKGSPPAIFEGNPWFMDVISRLDKGDLLLLELLRPQMAKTLSGPLKGGKWAILESEGNHVYPWLVILVESLNKNTATQTKKVFTLSLDHLDSDFSIFRNGNQFQST